MKVRFGNILWAGLLLVLPGQWGLASVGIGNAGKTDGFSAIAKVGDGWVAARTDGQIDWLTASGNIAKSEKLAGEKFYCLLSDNGKVIVGGANGSILVSSGKGVFKKIRSGANEDINSLAAFRGKIFAGTSQGKLLSGNEEGKFKTIQLSIKGNIVSLSADTSQCYGVTDEGEIFHTGDGINWTIFDFNSFYSGYYKPCNFTSVLVAGNRIAVAGKHADGSPVLLFSAQGNVWAERTLVYTDEQDIPFSLDVIPNGLFYDESKDQFLLACGKGKIMAIPSCSHCNKLYTVADEDINAIAGNSNILILAGGNNFFLVVNNSF
jgi:hypothetical protein